MDLFFETGPPCGRAAKAIDKLPFIIHIYLQNNCLVINSTNATTNTLVPSEMSVTEPGICKARTDTDGKGCAKSKQEVWCL